jgi:hypothetical protein
MGIRDNEGIAVRPVLVERAYWCVGTTVDQCLEVNTMFDSFKSAIVYDDTIMERFQDSFQNQD